MIKISALILLAAIAVSAPPAAAQNEECRPPKRIFHDDRELRYNPAWKSSEAAIKADLDGKPGLEAVISFIASHTPKPETSSEKKDPFDTTAPAIPIVQNYAFTQIYSLDAGGRYRCVKTVPGMDRPQALRLLTLDEQAPPALVIMSPGGEHYIDVLVLQWQNGGYRSLLETGASGDAVVLSENSPAALKIGAETWQWDGTAKRFTRA